jgi:hypothetical protein
MPEAQQVFCNSKHSAQHCASAWTHAFSVHSDAQRFLKDRIIAVFATQSVSEMAEFKVICDDYNFDVLQED